MNYGSICSGVEAATLAWKPLGWTAKFFAEVEPFPSAVLQQKFGATKPLRPLSPETADGDKDRKERETWAKQIAELPDGGSVPNLGDFTQITTKDYDGAIDLIVGGTPCQSYSLAGLRKGLADPRGNLALEFVKLAYRAGVRWTLWENVPGVLSSGGGKDFASLLSLLCGWEIDVPKDGWRKCGIISPAPGCFGLAWRILDAQYTRVPQFPRAIPQRRRRLFVVGYLGSWEYPAKVLFDGEMRGGDTPPRRTKGQTIAPGTEGGIASADTIRMRCGKPGGGKGALISHELSLTIATANDQTLVTQPESAKWWDGGDKAGTLTVTGNNQLMPDKGRLQCVIEPDKNGDDCFDIRQIEVHEKGISPTLVATDYKGGKAVMADNGPVCFENNPSDARLKEVPVAPTVLGRWGTGGNNTPLVINGEKNVCPTLEANLFNKNTFLDCEKFVVEESDEPIAFIKNDAGGEQQGYWQEVFPTVRSQVIPAIAYNVTFCDANGKRKDRPDGGLYVTEANAGNTVTAGGARTDTVVVERENNIGIAPCGMAVTGEVASTLGGKCEISTGRNGSYEEVIALDGDKMAKAERKGGSGLGVSTDGAMYTQTVKDVHAVAYDECVPLDIRNATRDPEKHDARNRQGVGVGEDGAPMNTVTAASVPGIGLQSTVRRLLPVECERLMGFPDGHTLIKWKGKPESECPDAPRYKACGNSMCVNVMAWIGQRIDAVEKEIQNERNGNVGRKS
nr:MAG TPA: Cytosine specific methyltransferase [Caudoviricetes sp.]